MLEVSRLRKLLLILLGVELLFVLLNIFPTPSVTLNRALNLDGENTLVVWFSSSQLLFLAAAAYFAFRKDGSKSWLLLAAGFLYLSIDETATLHESFGAAAYKDLISENYRSGDWMTLFAVPFALAVVLIIRKLLEIRRVSRLSFRFGILGLTLWAAVLGFEVIDSNFKELSLSYPEMLCHPLQIAEEFCELAGATSLLFSIGSYLAPETPALASHKQDNAITLPR